MHRIHLEDNVKPSK
jgi:hypothetical protein